MTLYAFALFVHIVGSLLLCTAFTAEGIGVLQLRRATTESAVRQWEGVLSLGRVFGPASVMTILASGLYMMISSWGGRRRGRRCDDPEEPHPFAGRVTFSRGGVSHLR